MWQDNDDKIMNILDNIETRNKKFFRYCPDYLEENKICIDEWVNKLIFSNVASNRFVNPASN